ncbi:hypothetical protein PPYR_03168 [Photinus pyralis]|uniref:CRAL-TRIO domain-containing protein n=2 Tax=Photinus pyralis TaxID=7054 RepID=A0A5N4A269_PHOPY|nr:alpha-tocopherol transfer protein-like [Photinus pyralis]KAB0791368.1 hypothetical protein PPYR_03168 [Photinus pyralis]
MMKWATLEEEYAKNKELHVEDVQSLKEWVLKQPHFPPVSDLQLAIFLHSCYWSVEQTKVTMEKFLTYRGAWRDFFANRNPNHPKMKDAMEVSLCSFLPSRTVENYKIVFFKFMNTDVDRYVTSNCLKIFDMCVTLEVMQHGTFEGYVIVCDFKNVGVGHILKSPITAMRRILLYLQEALPVRLKGLHYVTMPAISDLLVPLVKPFMKKELANLLHFHSSYETLGQHVPLEFLPEDAEGKAPPSTELHAKMQESFVESADFFVEQETFVSNEGLRDRRQSYMDVDLGIGTNGSFKKLELD